MSGVCVSIRLLCRQSCKMQEQQQLCPHSACGSQVTLALVHWRVHWDTSEYTANPLIHHVLLLLLLLLLLLNSSFTINRSCSVWCSWCVWWSFWFFLICFPLVWNLAPPYSSIPPLSQGRLPWTKSFWYLRNFWCNVWCCSIWCSSFWCSIVWCSLFGAVSGIWVRNLKRRSLATWLHPVWILHASHPTPFHIVLYFSLKTYASQFQLVKMKSTPGGLQGLPVFTLSTVQCSIVQ